MPLTLHLHPLSSYCHKVLMALYENGTLFETHTVNLMDAGARADYLQISPFGKIPTLTDSTPNAVINETSIIIEYLQQHYPGSYTAHPKRCRQGAYGAHVGQDRRFLSAHIDAEDRRRQAAS